MNGMSTNYGYLQPQHIPTAQSEESLKKLRMAPDSDVMIMHDTEPIVYICQTDSLGTMSYEAYDLVKRKSKEEENQDRVMNALMLMNQRLENLEARLNESFIDEECTQTANEPFAEYTAIGKGNENNTKPKGNGRTGTKQSTR